MDTGIKYRPKRNSFLTLHRTLLLAISCFLSAWVLAHAAAEPIDINSATAEQLKTLPGITEGLVLQIIGARPFQSKEELVQRNILSKELFEKIQTQIVVKASKAPSPRPSVDAPTESKDRLGVAPPAGKGADRGELGSPPLPAPSRACIREERTKQAVCGELIQ